MVLETGIAAFLLAITHLFAEKMKDAAIPRSKWLSFAGGVAVAYIFVHLLPALQDGQAYLQQHNLGVSILKHPVYLLTLLGLATFYGVERLAVLSSGSERAAKGQPSRHSIRTFWIHIIAFSVYNALVGYLLIHNGKKSLTSLLFFTVAMAFHFLVNDYVLFDHYRSIYRHKGRWVVTAAVLGGWLAGMLVDLPKVWIYILYAFVAGSTILNVLKEELPEERRSNFWSFASGMLVYSILLMFS
ncbi:hypothetical protein [Cesiribacter sp. SM1]|uniref:hypothetical protein n=1 Tax=Cesiribacter sp. SM1 TaxID=2861196 RepID=UPI001CD5BC2D|nr:hypothetical protein [Cesiribacter sp. SM1]